MKKIIYLSLLCLLSLFIVGCEKNNTIDESEVTDKENTIDESEVTDKENNIVNTIVAKPYTNEYSYDDHKEEDNIYYVISNNEAIIVGYDKNQEQDIVIKSSYEGYPTTRIGENAFYECKNLTSVVIPETVRRIGRCAFSGCTSLTSVTIAKESKSRKRFNSKCLTYIGSLESETCVDYHAFGGCSKLVNIELPKYITIIAMRAFENCTSLESIILPESVEEIYWQAFSTCTNLKSIYIPKNVKKIESYVFWDCPNLESIVVDSENKVYDSRDNCNAIVETATDTLIKGCNTIPNNIKIIEGYAFQNCHSLTTISISENVTKIYVTSFVNCDNITEIIVDKNNTVYDSRNNCNAIIETATNTLIVGCKNTKISNTIKNIGGYAFSGLSEITIPKSIKCIGNWAFSGSDDLTINYLGTKKEWNNISKYEYWNHGIGSYVIKCTNGKIEEDIKK